MSNPLCYLIPKTLRKSKTKLSNKRTKKSLSKKFSFDSILSDKFFHFSVLSAHKSRKINKRIHFIKFFAHPLHCIATHSRTFFYLLSFVDDHTPQNYLQEKLLSLTGWCVYICKFSSFFSTQCWTQVCRHCTLFVPLRSWRFFFHTARFSFICVCDCYVLAMENQHEKL